MLRDHRLRYLIVGAVCAGVHNAIMIAGAAVGAHYALSSAVSYATVVVIGFLLHSYFTFTVTAAWGSFARYAAGMLLNYPFWVALMFLFCDVARLPMTIAAPAGTVVMLVWNFAVSRWAILRRPPPTAASAPAATPTREAP
ncbi:MAG TPA: GtrA family protein [Caulobacteraceae bacterium]|nr:GtrA family protein [Caulobacteraceae bacterium]